MFKFALFFPLCISRDENRAFVISETTFAVVVRT